MNQIVLRLFQAFVLDLGSNVNMLPVSTAIVQRQTVYVMSHKKMSLL